MGTLLNQLQSRTWHFSKQLMNSLLQQVFVF